MESKEPHDSYDGSSDESDDEDMNGLMEELRDASIDDMESTLLDTTEVLNAFEQDYPQITLSSIRRHISKIHMCLNTTCGSRFETFKQLVRHLKKHNHFADFNAIKNEFARWKQVYNLCKDNEAVSEELKAWISENLFRAYVRKMLLKKLRKGPSPSG